MAPQVAKIDHSSLRDNAYAALRDAFISGAFAPGDTVSLRDLADQLGTSMTPVREAVRRLVTEGALVDLPNRKLAVPAFDTGRARDLKAARLALEGLVLDRAIDRVNVADIDHLEEIVAQPVQAEPCLRRNYDFHFTLYRMSGSEILVPLVEGLWTQYGAYLNLAIRRAKARTVSEEEHHLRLIDALRRGDRAAAHGALIADIERSFQILLSED